MSAEPAYNIDWEDEERFVVSVRKRHINRERFSRFLDYLALEQIREKSELTEEEAAEIANEIDRAVWERVRTRYEGA